jgi:tripartite-type tricarboxylate transporter receptor subunit TctC
VADAFNEQAVADFYRGKTVRIITGFAPGGAVDTGARMIARYLPQYIPGNPSVIVENRPGAGGLIAVNSVFAAEPKDGTAILLHAQGPMVPQLIGAEGVQFDASQFQWLGAMTKVTQGCIVRADTGVRGIEEVIAGREVILGALGPGTGTYEVPATMNALLGTNFKLVTGYGSLSEVRLQIQSREVDGFCAFTDALTSIDRAWLEGDNPFARVLITMNTNQSEYPFLRNVPAAVSLAKNEEDRQLALALAVQDQISRPFALPPGAPRDRVAALRQAFARTFADADLRAEAERAGWTIEPSTGPEVQQIVEEILKLPAAQRERLKRILS